ncbi:hypothetical protein [Streptomyces sp. enrichment culture]|uniref:hypothetical protein n=1 Tax=Streptomyces sp. enrichment culture TaxID=1795815 RepID=UPI003F55BEF8
MAARTRARKTMWGVYGAGALVVALTVYAVVASGGEDDSDKNAGGQASATASASPGVAGPSYDAPDEWTEPEKWASLPRGERTDDAGNPLGFPHTTEGAVAMLAATSTTEMDREHSAVDEQVGNYRSYISEADRSAANEAKVRQAAEQTDAKLRRQFGVGADADLPAGAYMRNHVVAFKVVKEGEDEVGAWLLSRGTTKAGETEKEQGGYTRTLIGAVWEDGDWRLSTAASVRATQAAGQDKPAIVAPGDAAFNDAGWTAIREAS